MTMSRPSGDMSRHFHLGELVEAKRLVKAFHYSQRWPAGTQLIGTFHSDGGLFGDSGPAIAACVFGQPATSRWRETPLELTRLVRDPTADVPLSALVSLTVKWVRRKSISDLLISYADATHGHHGGIYQACSWRYNGQRPPDMDGLTIQGQFVPARSANAIYGTNSPTRLRAIGVECEPHLAEGKHLYWLPLNRAGQRKAERLDLVAMPYPKPDRTAAA